MSAPRTCDDLGVCQARTPRCTGCAPASFGQEAADKKDRQISTLMRWALVWAVGAAAVAAVMFVAGALS